MTHDLLAVNGLVGRPLQLSRTDLEQLDASQQIADVSELGANRRGRAVRIAGILELAEVDPVATHLGLHGTRDDFHASIPLVPVINRGVLIFALDDEPLSVAQGGPFRFFIPDHAACHLDEIDECANVKFLDRIELTKGKGLDNRPQDDEQHVALARISVISAAVVATFANTSDPRPFDRTLARATTIAEPHIARRDFRLGDTCWFALAVGC